MDYLKELCDDLHLPSELEKTSSGHFALPLTSSLSVEVKPLDPGVFFYSPISPCPEVKREELFIQLMKGNLFGQGTLGGVIGLDPNENLLTLSSNIPYDVDYRAFKGALEDFVNIVEYWRDEIARHVEQAEGGIL